jgi:hypothetical protein
MRFLKRQTINRRQLKSTTVYSDVSDANVYINPSNSGSMVLPSGTNAQLPASPVNGMMRYNVDLDEVQVYQGSSWRSLRFKESSNITQQNLGTGDGISNYYGPLSPTPPSIVASGATWGGQNIMVYVENVYQLFGTNYTISQNPTATKTTTVTNNIGDTVISVPDVANIVAGQTVDASGAFSVGTTILSVNPIAQTFTVDTPLQVTINSGTVITFTYPAGYYVNFTSASVYNKPIIALHGFDQ